MPRRPQRTRSVSLYPHQASNKQFTLLFFVFLVLSVALWMFFRWLFNNDTSLVAIGFLSLVTAWFWAYIMGYGAEQHTSE